MVARQQILDANGSLDIEFEEELSDLQKEQKEKYEEILEAFNASPNDVQWSINVHRISGNNKLGMNEPYLFTVSPEELPVDQRLCDHYGTGKYRARCYRNKRLFRSFVVEVEVSEKPARTALPQTEITTMMQAFEASQARMFALLESKMTQPTLLPAPQPDPFQMMERLTTIMANLRGTPEPAVNGMDMFTKGIELASKMQNASGGETNLLDIVKEFIASPAMEGIAGAMMGAQANRNTQQKQQLHARPVDLAQRSTGQALPSPVAPPSPQNMGQDDMNKLVNDQLTFLVAQAKRNADPELYAELVIDQMPPAILTYILGQPNIIGELAQYNPEVANHIDWFNGLLNVIREMIAEENDASLGSPDNNDANRGRSTGNLQNTPNDGTNN